MSVDEFLKKAKQNAEQKAVKMAKLELSAWNEKHEQELKENFGFNDQTLKQRKAELGSIVNKQNQK